MSIIQKEFEVLEDLGGNNILSEGLELDEVLESSIELNQKWQNFIVDNEDQVNFGIDEEMKFHYLTEHGERREADITEFAFGQLCTRLGVPASYIKKCFDFNKKELALQNFHAWAGGCAKKLLVRESEGVVRAVLSDSYQMFDSSKVLKTLKTVVDKKKYKATQAFLSADKLHVRYIQREPLKVSQDESPIYMGVQVTSSDVGLGSLQMKAFIYRQVCTNGMIVQKGGGTLFKQKHAGSAITGGKMELFNRAFMNVEALSKQSELLIEQSQSHILKGYEMNMLIEKAKRDLKLSEKAEEKMCMLFNSYGHTKWGYLNAITELAQDYSLDTRVEYEQFAGDILMSK